MRLIEYVVDILSRGKSLPNKYRNHALKGVYKGYFDCHILPDLVLIYKIENDELLLLDIGTHSDLFWTVFFTIFLKILISIII